MATAAKKLEAEEPAKTHKIRITLTGQEVSSLEKGAYNPTSLQNSSSLAIFLPCKSDVAICMPPLLSLQCAPT